MAETTVWHKHVYQARGRWIAVGASGNPVIRLEGAGTTEAEARRNLDAVIAHYEASVR